MTHPFAEQVRVDPSEEALAGYKRAAAIGDQTRFTRRDEVDAEWRIISPIEEAWAAEAPPVLPSYAAGSAGPEEANALLERGGHSWSL